MSHGLSCYNLISLLFLTSGYPLPCARTNTMPQKRWDQGTDKYSEDGDFFSISSCGALGNAKFKCQFHISHMGSYVLKSAPAWLTRKQGHEIPSVSFSPKFLKYYRHFFSSIKPWQGLFDQNCQPPHGKTDKGWNSTLQKKTRAQKILEHRK